MSESDSPIVELCDIEKRYANRVALAGVSIEIAPGEVLGLVGPNGAGKSTLLGIIAGLIRPSAGGGRVLGERVGPRVRPTPFVGLMLEQPAFIEHRNGLSNLKALAAIRGEIGSRHVEDALMSFGLDPKDPRPVRAYSQGMRQRLSLAQALMEHPRLLLLDEPTNGLDPVGIIEMRRAVRAAAADGAAVIIASHLLAEVSVVCDRIVVLNQGRIARDLSAPGPGSSLETEYLAVVSGLS